MTDEISVALEKLLVEGTMSRRDAAISRLEKYWPLIERLVERGDSAASIARRMISAGFEGSQTTVRDAIGERFPKSKRSAPGRKPKRSRLRRLASANHLSERMAITTESDNSETQKQPRRVALPALIFPVTPGNNERAERHEKLTDR